MILVFATKQRCDFPSNENCLIWQFANDWGESFTNLQIDMQNVASMLKTKKVLRNNELISLWLNQRTWKETYTAFCLNLWTSEAKKCNVIKDASVIFINFYPTFIYLGKSTAITRLNRISWWHLRTYCKTYYNRLIF